MSHQSEIPSQTTPLPVKHTPPMPSTPEHDRTRATFGSPVEGKSMAPSFKETQDISLGDTENASDARTLASTDEFKLVELEDTQDRKDSTSIAGKRSEREEDQFRTPLEEIIPISLDSINTLLSLRSTTAREKMKRDEPQKLRNCASKRARQQKHNVNLQAHREANGDVRVKTGA